MSKRSSGILRFGLDKLNHDAQGFVIWKEFYAQWRGRNAVSTKGLLFMIAFHDSQPRNKRFIVRWNAHLVPTKIRCVHGHGKTDKPLVVEEMHETISKEKGNIPVMMVHGTPYKPPPKSWRSTCPNSLETA